MKTAEIIEELRRLPLNEQIYVGLPQKSINSLYRVDKQTFEC